jgi:class 3 adenylate cyclase
MALPLPDRPLIRLRVRMALLSGSAEERNGDYFGPPLNRVVRLLPMGHGARRCCRSPRRSWLGTPFRRE